MRRLLCFFLLLSLLLGGCGETGTPQPTLPTTAAVIQTIPKATTLPETCPEPEDEAFVLVREYVPGLWQELRYAAENNFTGQVIYDFTDAYLRYGTVKKLILVSEELSQQGIYLKIWDGFRPVAAQFQLWEVCPDPRFVANPMTGYSSHSRGNTVDLTLVDRDGWELEMPTGFDDFSAQADRDYSDCTEIQAQNALLLQQTMEKYGFTGYFGEWWHFTDTDSYPVEESFYPD